MSFTMSLQTLTSLVNFFNTQPVSAANDSACPDSVLVVDSLRGEPVDLHKLEAERNGSTIKVVVKLNNLLNESAPIETTRNNEDSEEKKVRTILFDQHCSLSNTDYSQSLSQKLKSTRPISLPLDSAPLLPPCVKSNSGALKSLINFFIGLALSAELELILLPQLQAMPSCQQSHSAALLESDSHHASSSRMQKPKHSFIKRTYQPSSRSWRTFWQK